MSEDYEFIISIYPIAPLCHSLAMLTRLMDDLRHEFEGLIIFLQLFALIFLCLRSSIVGDDRFTYSLSLRHCFLFPLSIISLPTPHSLRSLD